MLTAFNYVVSGVRGKEFKEPKIINHLLRRIRLLRIENDDRNLSGWALHFFAGILFVTGYHFIWTNNYYGSTFASALELGGITGIIWLVTWSFIFKYHPSAPKIRIKQFYLQIIAGQLIFAIGAWCGYHLTDWLK